MVIVAVCSPFYDNTLYGRVTILEFWGVRSHQVLTGKEESAGFGWQVELIDDGSRIAIFTF